MGAKLVVKDTGWKKFVAQIQALEHSRSLDVGVLENTAAGGAQHGGGDLTVAEIAAVQEFGTEDGHVPARSFMRTAFEESREALEKLGRTAFVKVVEGKATVDQVLGVMGAMLASAMKNKIREGDSSWRPLEDSTVRRKGSSKPLIDTQQMLRAITWAFAKREEKSGKGE